MQIGQIIYFYYDNILPCQKGRIKEVIDGGYEVNWLNDNNKSTGSSSVPERLVFATKEECYIYSKTIKDNKKNRLRNNLSTKESVLKYMFSAIYSDDYDWSSKKEVLKEKIKELFDVTID